MVNCINFNTPEGRRFEKDFGRVSVNELVSKYFSGEAPSYDVFISNKEVGKELGFLPKSALKNEIGKTFPKNISNQQLINLRTAIGQVNKRLSGVRYETFNVKQIGQADLYTWDFRKIEGNIDLDAKLERAKNRVVDASQSTSKITELERLKQRTEQRPTDDNIPGGTQLSFFQLDLTPATIEAERERFAKEGITLNQKSNIGIINKLTYRAVTPSSYSVGAIAAAGFPALIFGRSFSQFKSMVNNWSKFSEKVLGRDFVPEWGKNLTEDQYKKREDAWLLSNGLPQKHNTFKYVGRGFIKDGKLVYDINGEDVYDFNDVAFKNEEIDSDIKKFGYGVDRQNFVMGNYGISTGRDEIGHYLKYTDRWDLDVANKVVQAAINATQKPFIVTGKIYRAGSFDEDGNFFNYYTSDSNNPEIAIYNDFMQQLGTDEEIESADKKYEDKKASPELIKLIKEFIKQIGVDYQTVSEIVVNGKKQDAAGVALIMQKLIQVVEGKEDVALPEEAMHFAVEIIEQTNPKLFNKLLKEINDMPIYDQVKAAYSTNPYYQKDGKPNIRKLKKEAIARALVDVLQDKIDAQPVARTWWESILDFLKSLFNQSGFDSLSRKILSGEYIGSASELRATEDDVFFNLSEQDRVVNRLKEIASKIDKKPDNEEDSSSRESYYFDGKKVQYRVTDFSKEIYANFFGNRKFTEFQDAINELKAEKGTLGHKHIETAFDTFVDPDTNLLRDEFLDSDEEYRDSLPSDVDRDAYDLLKDNLRERLLNKDIFPKGTKFFREIPIYDGKNTAGTIDFLAVTPEGKVNILDWKFIDLNINKFDDIPPYKAIAWMDQLDRYKQILTYAYGIKAQDFQQTRAIPILAMYSPADYKKNIMPKLLRIKIGAANVKNIKEDYLLPVGVESERTGKDNIDELIDKFNAVKTNLSSEDVSDEEKADKWEQVNSLFRAIRALQVKEDITPLINQGTLLSKQVSNFIKKYNDEIAGKDKNEIDDQQLEAYSKMFRVHIEGLMPYLELRKFKYLLGDDEVSQLVKNKLTQLLDDVQTHIDTLESLKRKFGEEYVGASYNAEKVVKGLSRWLGNAATIQLENLHRLFKLVTKAGTLSSYESSEQIEILSNIRKEYDKWAELKNLKPSEYFNIIRKSDENELIDQYQEEFYTELRDAINRQDFDWIAKNVDQQAYVNKMKEKLDEKIKKIQSKDRGVLTEEEHQAQIKREIIRARDEFDVSTKTSYGWLNYKEVKNFPNSSWESSKWIELNKPENAPAKRLYDYIIERNKEYQSIGYLKGKNARVFLPFIEGGITEGLVFDGVAPNLLEGFLQSISINESDTEYGQQDKVTGEYLHKLPRYFTSKIEEGYSKDLFKNLALYNHFAIRYKNFLAIEEQARLLESAERNKKAIMTSKIGTIKYENGKIQYDKNNNSNAKLFSDIKNSIIYNKKYIESESFDIILGKLSTFGKKINETIGINIFPKSLDTRQISVNKILDQMNRQFSLTALGINTGSALSNLFGGSANALINSGKFMTKRDYLENQLWVLTNHFRGKDNIDAKKAVAAIKYFMPFIENENLREIQKFSLLKLDAERVQEFLMILMRSSDKGVQTVNFFSFFNNAIIEDGKILNVREYLRSTDEYKDFYTGTSEERTARKEKFEKDVKALLEEKGLAKLSTVDESGNLVIPNIERKSDTVIDFRRMVQQFTSDALGSLTEENRRLINMTVYGSSLMLFKNWIPRLVDVRMGDIKYNAGYDAYEWGRYRTVLRLLTTDILKSMNSLTAAIGGNGDVWLKQIRELYEAKSAEYYNNTGKELKMTESEFIALVNQNIKNQAIELAVLLTLQGIVFGLKAAMPDDDEDPAVRNQWRYFMYVTDKLRDELSYFYDPTSLVNLLSKGMFPALSLIDNYKKFILNFLQEGYGLVLENDELVDDAKPIKYLMKSFPITNQMSFLLPIVYPELAKDLGIKMQSTYGMK